jgi:hypothetical protein
MSNNPSSDVKDKANTNVYGSSDNKQYNRVFLTRFRIRLRLGCVQPPLTLREEQTEGLREQCAEENTWAEERRNNRKMVNSAYRGAS